MIVIRDLKMKVFIRFLLTALLTLFSGAVSTVGTGKVALLAASVVLLLSAGPTTAQPTIVEDILGVEHGDAPAGMFTLLGWASACTSLVVLFFPYWVNAILRVPSLDFE